MSIIAYELAEVRKICENVVANSKIITCNAEEPALVRIDISHATAESRQLTVCLRFPSEYPEQAILVELKSRKLSDKFLDCLANLSEAQARQQLGKPQVLHVLKFLRQYLEDNPLVVCFDEIQQLRQQHAVLKLKQRTSTIIFSAKANDYFYRLHAVIPDDYPRSCVSLEQQETNLPAVLLRYLNGQSKEIARQCVEPPLRLAKEKLAEFVPAPSLYRSLKFCLDATNGFLSEECPICQQHVLPANPADVMLDDSNDAFVERVYCGHLYHQGCLKKYMQEPPFPKGGKLCAAKRLHPRSDDSNYMASKLPTTSKAAADAVGKCNMRLAHDRWVVNVKVAESRWAQRQARERELQEVVDFLS